MKLYIKSAKELTDSEIQKNFDFNNRQTQVGSKLKTYRGSPIQRSRQYGVGKEIGGDIYFHKDYADDIINTWIWEGAKAALEHKYPYFEYNCIRYSPDTGEISFQEVPDFDTSREPVVGDYITVLYDPETDTAEFKKPGHSNYIFHHKWAWVENDYTGFDVADSWNWSKRWLSTLKEKSDGNGIGRWNAQLDRYHLPHDR